MNTFLSIPSPKHRLCHRSSSLITAEDTQTSQLWRVKASVYDICSWIVLCDYSLPSVYFLYCRISFGCCGRFTLAELLSFSLSVMLVLIWVLTGHWLLMDGMLNEWMNEWLWGKFCISQTCFRFHWAQFCCRVLLNRESTRSTHYSELQVGVLHNNDVMHQE